MWRHYGIYMLVAAAAFAFGLLSEKLFFHSHTNENAAQLAIREYDRRYEFIRPLLICQINENEEAEELSSLERQVNNVITSAISADTLKSAAVYFRDLNSARWMGVNELEPYDPASLLKVPIMMAYFKASERQPKVLTMRFPYEIRDEGKDVLVKEPLLIPGRTYTVFDHIRAMIIQSDNSAKEILEEHINQKALDETYNVLGIKDPYSTGDGLYELSAKSYGLFFRVLYNGTYLNREMSNQALEVLSKSEFTLGLRAGTPESIPVAHKYGVRGFKETDGSPGVELSDCGIIYDPSSPYLLCIMTHGSNPYALAEVIKNIAQTVYHAVSTNNY